MWFRPVQIQMAQPTAVSLDLCVAVVVVMMFHRGLVEQCGEPKC